MSTERERTVMIGELKTGSEGDFLKATLGSCVGIGLLWKRRAACGLAHCLLPEAPADSSSGGAKYVDQAVASLLHLMEIREADLPEIEAVIVGGGNLIKGMGKGDASQIGAQNAEAAKKCIEGTGIRIAHLEVGGNEGRQIVIDCSRGLFHVKCIPNPG